MLYNLKWKTSNVYIRNMLLPLILFLGLIGFLYFGVSQTKAAANKESLKYLENAIQRATVQCYAIEGMYPPDIAYLEKNYGIIVDHKKYAVHYEVFAANILPDITVLDLSGFGGDFDE